MDRIVDVLGKVAAAVDNYPDLRWLVTGSMGLLLHGVLLPEPPRDLDLCTDGPGATRIQQILAAHCVMPVQWSETPVFANHFGLFSVDSVRVEVAGDLEVKGPGFVHHFTISPRVWQERRQVTVVGPGKLGRGLQTYTVGLAPLEHQLLVNLIRKRQDRVERIVGLMLADDCVNWDYLDAVFAADAVPAAFQAKVRALLQSRPV